MDAFFWSDGQISLILDNVKVLDSITVEGLEEQFEEGKKQDT